MIGPREMPDASVNVFVRVSGALGSELPYRPEILMFAVEICHQAVEWIAIGSRWIAG